MLHPRSDRCHSPRIPPCPETGRPHRTLWPAKFSIPQRILRILEWFINLRRGQDKFRFHPDEISQLRSVRQGKEVLMRNGFRPVVIDIGWRTLTAFETLVGEK
jgi:hypothetical protein